MISFKKAVRKIHLVLGFTSGLVVFILAVTGCLYAFEHEITHFLRREDIMIRQESKATLPLGTLWEQIQDQAAPREISWVRVYNDPSKSWVFTCLKKNNNAITYFGSIDYYTSIYVNPNTGEILGVYDEEETFLNIVKYLHWSLLLKTEYGQPIIGWSTFIFVFILVSGLILWWPKNRKARKKKLWFKWKQSTRWRRKNYDLHSIAGVYVIPVVLTIALSGMIWAFPWFKTLVYIAGAGTSVQPDLKPAVSHPIAQKANIPLDNALYQSKVRHPDAAIFRITPPKNRAGTINVTVRQKDGAYFVSHHLQFDQYSGELLRARAHEEKNVGEKLTGGNYDIHTGTILGLPGKIMAFIASLICASLPVTGSMLWYGRMKKRNTPKRVSSYNALKSDDSRTGQYFV